MRARVRHAVNSRTTRAHYLRLVAPFSAVNPRKVLPSEPIESWTRAAIPEGLSAPWCLARTLFWSMFRANTIKGPGGGNVAKGNRVKNILATLVEFIGGAGVTNSVWATPKSRSLRAWSPFLFAQVNVMVALSFLEYYSWNAMEC